MNRNPGGTQSSPWCYVDIVINQSVEKVIELCDIPNCSDKMWLYVIAPFASLIILIITMCICLGCRKYRKNAQRDGITNIQNVCFNCSLFFYSFHSNTCSHTTPRFNYSSIFQQPAKIFMEILV